MNWSRFLPSSITDFRGLFSRQTAILVLMAVILCQVTGILYGLLKLQLVRMRPAAAEPAKVTMASAREPADAYRIVPERNLFGTKTGMPAERRTGAFPSQEAPLPIELRGTVAGDARFGFAVIEEKGSRKQRLVKVGDTLMGVQVLRIKRNAIDLLVNEREQTLRIVETKEGAIPPPSPAPAPGTAPGAIILSRSEIDERLRDMGSLLRQALVRPYFTAGVPDGFLISNIRPGSLYTKMGMMDGDIIQEVNNRKIQTADDVMGLLNTIRSGSSLSVTVKRQGNPVTMNYLFQ
ncbi:MAG: type II secretion system protein N [Thermodesulfobacteriota bacterium]